MFFREGLSINKSLTELNLEMIDNNKTFFLFYDTYLVTCGSSLSPLELVFRYINIDVEFSSTNHTVLAIKDIRDHNDRVITGRAEQVTCQQLGSIPERLELVVGVVVDVEMGFTHVANDVLVGFQCEQKLRGWCVFSQG